jgi:hypothetical protein
MSCTTETIRPLPETFRHGGFDYTLLRRQGLLALAQKTSPKWKQPMFEVGWLRQLPAQTCPSGRDYPARESFFRDEDFGKTAFDLAYDRDGAETAFARMAREASPSATVNDSEGGGAVLTLPEPQVQKVSPTRAQETAFQPLPPTWQEAEWRFRLLKRSGMVALVAKSKGGRDHYEVVVIQQQDARTWPSGRTTPACEAMPSSEEWGKYGWSPYDLPAAQAKFAELVAHHCPAAQPEADDDAQQPAPAS